MPYLREVVIKMENIVKRKVYDSYVRGALESDPTAKAYLDNVGAYQKDVKTTLDRIELSRSKSGLIVKDITSHFRSTFNNVLQDSDKSLPCEFSICDENGKVNYRLYISFLEVKLLKALAVEQMSYCLDYSVAVGIIFGCVLKSVCNGKHEIEWVPDPNFSDLQLIIFNAFAKYIASVKEKGV